MILQALTRLYEDLSQKTDEEKRVPKFGYSNVLVSAIAQIDTAGRLVSIIPANSSDPLKKSPYNLPLQLKRSGSLPPAYFLSDNSQYVFGIEKDGVTEKALKRFQIFKSFHETLLRDDTSIEAQALCNYLKNWDPNSDENIEILNDAKAVIATGQIIFRVLETSTFLHEVDSILERWEAYYSSTLSDVRGMCLVTGKNEPIARIHNSVKNIKADTLQPNGWSLVAFDKDSRAFSSFGKVQGENAPVGEYAAFAYTTALNHLLADRENVHRIGDTTVVSWAEGAEPEYNDFSNFFLHGDDAPEQISTGNLHDMVDKLSKGRPYDALNLDMSRRFYILGLAPNAARLSVRFFYNSTFGELMKNVAEHHQRLEVVGNRFPIMPLWAIMREIEKTKKKGTNGNPAEGQDKEKKTGYAGSKVLAGEITRAVFWGTPYPTLLIEKVMMKIRTEQDEKKDGKRIEKKVTPARAAIIKAYYLKNKHECCPEEVLTVSLNESSTNVPYTLGRLFAVYEAVQEAANPGINATIKDRYFNAASSTPALVFPTLDKLALKHLKKLKGGQKVYFERQVGMIKNILGETNPRRLNFPEQGSFVLGYYHQKEARYVKKEEL